MSRRLSKGRTRRVSVMAALLVSVWGETWATNTTKAKGAFNPFDWRTYRFSEFETRPDGVRFEYQGVRWVVSEHEESRLERAWGFFGDWSVHLSWEFPLGDPAATASTDSRPPAVAERIIVFEKRCSAMKEEWEGLRGWFVSVVWNQSGASVQEWSKFRDRHGMRSGPYRVRLDNGGIRSIEVKSNDDDILEDRHYWFAPPGFQTARVVGTEDAQWLTRAVRAGRKLRMFARIWTLPDRSYSQWLDDYQSVTFSLKGSSRMLDALEAHCARLPVALD